MNNNSIYRRLFFFMIGVVVVSLIIGAVGYMRGKNNEQLATRVRELEGQLNAKGVITETAASTGPEETANSKQSDLGKPRRDGPIANSKPKQVQKNVAQAAENPAEQSKPTGPAQVIAVGGADQEATTQPNWTPPAPPAGGPSPSPTPIPTVTIKIQHLGTFTPEVRAGDTALSVLHRVGEQNGFQVRTTQYWFGEFVDCIGDLCFDDHHYWAFYFNGQYSNIGASAQSIVAGDTSEWKWEEF
jgi:hypothetical protein